MKLTKCCIFPWAFMQFHAGGMMQPCAVGPDTDMGDLLIDFIEKKKGCKGEDFLNNQGLQMLREGMLTGNLRPMCQNCFFVSNDLVTVEEFRKELKEYLQSRIGETFEFEKADLTKTYGYSWMAVSFTNRCNLSCVYCVQSELKDSNPYFKAEIPYEHTEEILDMMVEKGIDRISTCVEGEATIYKYWRQVFSKFHKKHPHVGMWMTTNLNREYSDEDMELLAGYTTLDISLDSLKPELYSRLRRNGRLDLLLKNLDKLDDKIKELGVKGPIIVIHMVVSSETWTEMEEIAEFAYARGYGITLGNYEERANTVAYKTQMLTPIDRLPEEEQTEARNMIQRIQKKAEDLGLQFIIQGDIFTNVNKNAEHNFHRFEITDHNPVYEAFLEKYPKGEKSRHFDIVYDRDNISYAGIYLDCGEELCLQGLPDNLKLVYREVKVYEDGHNSNKYHFPIEPGYRKIMTLTEGELTYQAQKYEHVKGIILDFSEFWIDKDE